MSTFKVNKTERPRRYQLAEEMVKKWGGKIEPKDDNSVTATVPDEHDEEFKTTFPYIVTPLNNTGQQLPPSET